MVAIEWNRAHHRGAIPSNCPVDTSNVSFPQGLLHQERHLILRRACTSHHRQVRCQTWQIEVGKNVRLKFIVTDRHTRVSIEKKAGRT